MGTSIFAVKGIHISAFRRQDSWAEFVIILQAALFIAVLVVSLFVLDFLLSQEFL